MPRQPFLPQYQNAEFRFGIRHIKSIPDIAQGVGECIMLWSYVDLQMAMLLASILKTDTEPAAAMFLALKNARAQREVMIAAAKATLQDEALEAFEAVMNVYRGLSAQRADLAHGLFTVCKEISEGALWTSTTDHAKGTLQILANIGDENYKVALQNLKRDTFVYKIDDLERLYEQVAELWHAVFNLASYITHPRSSLTVGLFHQLCALPQIQQEIARLRETKSKSLESQP